MSDSEDFLSEIESASRQMLTFERLIASAAASFRLIEPFNAAKSDHPDVTLVIENIRQKNLEYYYALNLSTRAAQRGYTFCSDAENLCAFLVDGNSSREDLRAFIFDMRNTVQIAHNDALQVSALFRSARRGLLQVTQRIPATLTTLREEKDRATKSKEKSKRHSTFWKGGAVTASTGAAVVVATLALGFSFPPAVLFIPVVLPLISLMSAMAGSHALQRASRRETQAVQCAEAMDQLRSATRDIIELVQHVDQLVNWWLGQDTILKNLSEKVDQLRPTQTNIIRVKKIGVKWGQIKTIYLEYISRISRLQDLYPSSILGD